MSKRGLTVSGNPRKRSFEKDYQRRAGVGVGDGVGVTVGVIMAVGVNARMEIKLISLNDKIAI